MQIEELKIIKYNQWSNYIPKKPYFNIFPEKIIVHGYCFTSIHAKKERSSKFKGIKTLRTLQKRHIKKLGTVDIKYHFVIAPNGDVYECRPIGTAAYHGDKWLDNHSISVMIYGNFNVEQPKREQIHSFLLLLKHIKKIYPHLNIPSCIFNHCDLKLTLCPGHHLANMIRKIQSRTGVKYD